MTIDDRDDSMDDDEHFKDIIGDVHPLKHDRYRPYSKKTPSQTDKHEQYQPTDEASEQQMGYISSIHPSIGDTLGADDKIAYNAPHIGHKLLRQLRQGKLAVEATCDLHGLNIAQANQCLGQFIYQSLTRQLRCVRIVHGKGGAYAKMKTWCAQVLREHDDVLAIFSCIPRHGGTGAVYVLLRQRKQHDQ